MAIYIPKGWKDYSSDGWSAESSNNAGFLALSMHNISSQMGIQTNILNAPMRAWNWDKLLQFSGVRIEFKNQDYGCSLEVVIINEEKIERKFFGIWKYFVDKNIFWGGPYQKDLTAEKVQKASPRKTTYPRLKQTHKKTLTASVKLRKPWEHMPDENEDMKKIVYLWCTTDMLGTDIAKEISIGETTFSNYLSDLRSKYPEAGIPKGTKERSRYLREWEKDNRH